MYVIVRSRRKVTRMRGGFNMGPAMTVQLSSRQMGISLYKEHAAFAVKDEMRRNEIMKTKAQILHAVK